MKKMSNKEFQYQKINFILSVLGFIGSLAFYYGVLRDLNAQAPDKQKVEKLQKEIKILKSELKKYQNKH